MMERLAEFLLFGFVPLTMGILVAPDFSLAAEKSVQGEVMYRERIALPPNAVVTVQLADVSLADAPAAVLGEQVIDPAGQVPVAFDIKFDSETLRPNMTYALQARITVDNQLWFINDTRYQLDPAKDEKHILMLTRVAAQDESKDSEIFDTVWLAEDLHGGGVIDFAQSTLSIKSDGAVSGRGGCNSYFSKAELKGDGKISFGNTGSTEMACPPAVMDQERKLFDALAKAASYRVEEGKLYLIDAEGKDLARFAASS